MNPKKKILTAFRIAMRRLPGLNRVQHIYDLRANFPVESALFAGKDLSTSSLPSIIHYSFNKAASQYVMEVLAAVAQESSMLIARMSHYCFESQTPYLTDPNLGNRYHYVFHQKGFLYSSFAGPIWGLPNADKYRHIVMIRDPRDILVSNYYSVAYSHAIPTKFSNKRIKLLTDRQLALGMTVDEFVLSKALDVKSRFESIESGLLHGRYPVYVCKYEEMVENFQNWLSKIVNACGLSISEQLFQSLVEQQNNMKPLKENLNRHLRKGTPGDFREKLNIKTINSLNTILQPVLNSFNYELA